MFSIASVHQSNSLAYGASSDKAKDYLALSPSEINNSKFKTTANAPVINAVTGGIDYSYGATMWDGIYQIPITIHGKQMWEQDSMHHNRRPHLPILGITTIKV